MSSLLHTVDDLIDQIQSMCDEENRDSINPDTDILPALNRAQDFAFDILARKYPEPILASTTIALTGGTSDYDIPENVFEDRVEKIEIVVPSGSGFTYQEVRRISYQDASTYESSAQRSIPYYYYIFGRTIRFVTPPSGQYNARVWHLRNPEKLVKPQGRVTVINTASNYVVVDSAGDSLTTESDQLGSYVNVVDGQTGEIKGTLQIQSIVSNKITFRTVSTRSTVLNRTIDSLLLNINIAQDDYLAPIAGTCVPYYGKPVSNFLIQFAVAELTRKLGGESDKEEAVLEKFEKQVERTWSGRENTTRIKKRSKAWDSIVRRWEW